MESINKITMEDLSRVQKVLNKNRVPIPHYVIYNGESILLTFWTRIKLFISGVKIINANK